MTDKPKAEVVSLKAVPKEGKPVEDKKYKVSEEVITRLQEIVDNLKTETSYEVEERLVSSLGIMLDAAQRGVAHDMFCMMHHKDSIWTEGCTHVVSLSQETASNPYKFMLLAGEIFSERMAGIQDFLAAVGMSDD